MTDDELRKEIDKYKWFHSFKLNDNVFIQGSDVSERNQMIEGQMDKLDFTDKRVLDVGCRDGLFSFIAERKGASRIYAIDNCLSFGTTEFLIPYFNSKIEMAEVGLFDLKPSNGQFDIILFLGVLYHLRYPFWALKVLSDLLPIGGRIIVETAIMGGKNEKAMLHCPSSEDSPYQDRSSVTFFNIKGLKDALRSVGIQVDEVGYRNTNAESVDNEDIIIRASVLCTKVRNGPGGSNSEILDCYWRGGSDDELTKRMSWSKDRVEECYG